MTIQKTNLNSKVTDFLDELKHPFRKEIEQNRHDTKLPCAIV